AEQGNANAQYNVGVSYELGFGVPQDYLRAHMWYNLAASNGDDLAPENRDKIAEKMTPAQIVEAQALARACVAKDYKGC
ncbi:MAG: SEL1-like repeat protein, partial [Proteobacteria bacterium]|nr:SEL1-like repeat protein [Pseudomonadota bacterium]